MVGNEVWAEFVWGLGDGCVAEVFGEVPDDGWPVGVAVVLPGMSAISRTAMSQEDTSFWNRRDQARFSDATSKSPARASPPPTTNPPTALATLVS